MKKMYQLKIEAIEACECRGHKMRRFKTMDSFRAISSCKICDKLVCVNIQPLPNDIDICGGAVALECYTDSKVLIRDLWENIENGTIEENFSDLRSRVRRELQS